MSRIEVVSGDFFVDALPSAHVIVMGNILHDWNEQGKRMLIAKAYAALPADGALIAIENVIDDARPQNAFGLLMWLNILQIINIYSPTSTYDAVYLSNYATINII